MLQQNGVVSPGFKTAPKTALTSHVNLWRWHHRRDADACDDRADPAFDAPL